MGGYPWGCLMTERDRGVGPFLASGIGAAIVAFLADQASKLWLLYVFNLPARGATRVTGFLDLVLAWNTGISYGWFQSAGPFGQIVLLSFKALAVVLLAAWLARAGSRLTALALGLIIGGALGNALDRVLHGAVVDFVLLHLDLGGRSYNWYVFNLADAAIVAGVAMLLYDTLFGQDAAKAP